jgi:hypothetical protein
VANSEPSTLSCLNARPPKRRKRNQLHWCIFVVAAPGGSVTFGLLMPACTPKGASKEPVRASPPNLGADLSRHSFSCLGNKSSAREPPFGVQAGNRKDKPEGHGAASRPKGGSRARCARGSGSQLSSPVRAEHVLSLRKTLQRLVCRVLSPPSVGLQTGCVCRGKV